MEKNTQKGLYTPEMEHDACGIGFVAHLKGKKSRNIVVDALNMLANMEHRGATGFEANTGDGAGILLQTPHDFFVEECAKIGIDLPDFGAYGVGMIFFPNDVKTREACRKIFNVHIEELGFELLGYRDVPKLNKVLGASAIAQEPKIEQVFLRPHNRELVGDHLERRLFILRNYTSHYVTKNIPENNEQFYIATLSHKVIAYKGQFTASQVFPYFLDLHDERFTSAIAMIHSRFSTNTFPKWRLAQPFRFIAHNGEINTIRGNVNWMRSNETVFESSLFTKEEMRMLLPTCNINESDSANLDNMIEMLVLGGRSIPHVMMMLIPEAWQEDKQMRDPKKSFYEYHASLIEPWDGPASICFTDGKVVGATLDRNGLRPSRYCITDDDILIMSSEAGALRTDPAKIVKKGRLEPGKIFIADLEQGRIISDDELKQQISSRQPYRLWLNQNETTLQALPNPEKPTYPVNLDMLLPRQIAFGYSSEDLKVILTPMAITGKEPIGSMGADIPLAILSKQSRHLADYFKQQFAQVSNPPIDSIRERTVMSLNTSIGRIFNILSETPLHCRQITHPTPVITNDELDKIRKISHRDFRVKTIHTIFKADGKPGRLEEALDYICSEADKAIVDYGNNILLLSDRDINKEYAPIPSVLAVGAIHHHLINNGLRVRTGIVVEAGDARETHHFATLIGYGANVVNPYMVFESIVSFEKDKHMPRDINNEKGYINYVKAIGEGLLKIFSKMGISTLQSYQGAQIFEAIGLSSQVIDKCFAGTISKLEGLDFDGIANEVLARHRIAFSERHWASEKLSVGGKYQWKHRGEHHSFNPETIMMLQQAVRLNDYELYKQYAKLINDQSNTTVTLRGLLDFRKRQSIPLSEVESKEAIFKRFATGAMSFGSISHEAHTNLAIAMNRIGGKSNSGEGGEDEIRFDRKPNGDWERSAIKQVASGRFGVTSHYLVNADELQIKMAQGAKPGEGGQLPGHKVDEWIAKVRHSTPSVGLISPPPHHDIYSIEDLSQLIFDLKNANPTARISVKLVSKAGVGTIAAGVAKAKADVVLIAGHDGGTGASPISSVHHTGTPWELGLSETHQTLVRNKLRDRITVQADGQMRSGRDIAIATLLGAEEWGVSTAALVAEGCIMMRKCHLNTCPVGVATQNKELRKTFAGKPEDIINLFTFFVEELREIMAELGFRTINEMVGQVDVLKMREDISFWKLKNLDLSPILYKEPTDEGMSLYKTKNQEHPIDDVMDRKLIELAQPALLRSEPVTGEFPIFNIDRAVGTMLSGDISKIYKAKGLPEGTIHFKFRGSAGQSFGAFGASGLRLELEGEANDYFGKGLSGAQLIVYPDRTAKFVPHENVIIGNVAFYGATSGEAYINGLAGERFAVRNSGAQVVVEGVGAHACEYMTGGVVAILGQVGRNFGAGMSGGIAYLYDLHTQFDRFRNKEVDFEYLDYEDEKVLKRMITNHLLYTNSIVAKQMLDNWNITITQFIKIMPEEYKEALRKYKLPAQAEAKAAH